MLELHKHFELFTIVNFLGKLILLWFVVKPLNPNQLKNIQKIVYILLKLNTLYPMTLTNSFLTFRCFNGLLLILIRTILLTYPTAPKSALLYPSKKLVFL